MLLNPTDPAYLIFEKIALPVAVEHGIAIQSMKNFGNAFLLHYVLNLAIHATAIGCSARVQWDDFEAADPHVALKHADD